MKLLTQRQEQNLMASLAQASDWAGMTAVVKRVKADWTDTVGGERLFVWALTNANVSDVAQRIVGEGGVVSSDDVAAMLQRMHALRSEQIIRRIDDAIAAGWDPHTPTGDGMSVWIAAHGGINSHINLDVWGHFRHLGVSPVGHDADGRTLLHCLAASYRNSGGMLEMMGMGSLIGGMGGMMSGLSALISKQINADAVDEAAHNQELTNWVGSLVALGVDPLAVDSQGHSAFSMLAQQLSLLNQRVGDILTKQGWSLPCAGPIPTSPTGMAMVVAMATGGKLMYEGIPAHHEEAYTEGMRQVVMAWEDACGVDYLERGPLIDFVRAAVNGTGVDTTVIAQPKIKTLRTKTLRP